MKHRVLKSIAHNFSHSFVKYTNYFDDGHVVDDLLQLARKADGERISVHWIPDSPIQRAWPPRVLKSIAHYQQWLPTHIQSAGASVEAMIGRIHAVAMLNLAQVTEQLGELEPALRLYRSAWEMAEGMDQTDLGAVAEEGVSRLIETPSRTVTETPVQ